MIHDPIRDKLDEEAGIQAARMLGEDAMAAFDDPTTMEVYVTPGGALWVDRLGSGRKDTGHRLPASRIESFLAYMASHAGEILSPAVPRLQAAMPRARFARARLQGFIPPRSPDGPGFNLRKHPREIHSLHSYVARGALSVEHHDLLLGAMDGRRNILVVGGTKSGKTTFLNAIIRAIAERFPADRLVLIEDTRELQCAAPDHVFLQTLPGESMAEPAREVLRLSPDRVFAGEFRDAAALHVADLWSTGHPGGAATTHADDAEGGLERMNRLALDGKVGSHKFLIASAVGVVVVMRRAPGGGGVADLALVNGLDERDRFILERPAARGANPRSQ